MRIAIISPPFVAVPPVRYGGTELVVASLVDGLRARGHDVTLYASGDSHPGVPVRGWYPAAVWPPDQWRELTHAAWAALDLDRREVDVVHAHCPAVLGVAPWVRAPMIHTLHGEREEGILDLMRLSERTGRVVHVAISERQRARCEGLVHRVVHHGLPDDRYPLGRGPAGYAAFVGRFAREKGVAEALDAAEAAGVPLRLAGRAHPGDAPYFAEEVVPRLARSGVRWLGEIGLATKTLLFGAAIATLFPARWEEPFGLVLVESMLCGAPVIAFRRGSVPEIVDEGITGFVVDDVAGMAARLDQLRSRPFDRARCRARAIARFGADRMVDAYEALYREAVGVGLPVAAT